MAKVQAYKDLDVWKIDPEVRVVMSASTSDVATERMIAAVNTASESAKSGNLFHKLLLGFDIENETFQSKIDKFSRDNLPRIDVDQEIMRLKSEV